MKDPGPPQHKKMGRREEGCVEGGRERGNQGRDSIPRRDTDIIE